jgi:ABC-type polar amino acid transport system ATPase subunit
VADDGATDDPGAIFEPPTADPASKDPNFLELRGVEKRFGENKVLNGIDLTVGEHELVSLIGASGCGKSTLLRCVNALEPIQAGTISQGVIREQGPPNPRTQAFLKRIIDAGPL